MKGLVASFNDWIKHPMHSDGSVLDWAAFLVLILIVSFLWSTVIKAIE